ncbi:MAG: hypothetical protein QOH26_1492 [Actinomycetota bacterium]|nr:hypothetical protein [Actinomycetota bacterium]
MADTLMRNRTLLEAGTQAPDFRLPTTPEQKVALSDFLGQPVVLVFYPADWSPVCSDQLVLYQEVMPELKRYDAQVLGISCDQVWCHLAFAKDRKLRFPLLADFEPKGEVSRAYNAYRNEDGYSERALAVIDQDGRVAWSYLSPVGINPGADGILRALDELAGKS